MLTLKQCENSYHKFDSKKDVSISKILDAYDKMTKTKRNNQTSESNLE